MATLPYFVFSPSTVLSLFGFMRGPDRTRPTPAEDWRAAAVEAVIPALNAERTIVPCLASLMRQSLKPSSIVVVDDGSTDDTLNRAQAFCEHNGLPFVGIRRQAPIGKTVTLKRQARSSTADVLFVLDADTVLESDNYLERTVQQLHTGAGVASVCGLVRPMRNRDWRAWRNDERVAAFHDKYGERASGPLRHGLRAVSAGITNAYRDVLYTFLQRYTYRGAILLSGSMLNPVGCAVAYRREYLQAMFDAVEPRFGDDLSNSEDIFIGFAMVCQGYRNVLVDDVEARTIEPEFQRLPSQVYLWSSAFLQSCYYFDSLLRSPAKRLRHHRLVQEARRKAASLGSAITDSTRAPELALAAATGTGEVGLIGHESLTATDLATPPVRARRESNHGAFPGDRRRIREPYRQAFGVKHTEAYGRPVGWFALACLIEKISFPVIMLLMLLFFSWKVVLLTIALETAVSVTVLFLVARGRRLHYVLKGVAVAPVRYALLGFDLYTISRFAVDLWISRNRKWRK